MGSNTLMINDPFIELFSMPFKFDAVKFNKVLNYQLEISVPKASVVDKI
jgi:hypothetical protein